MLENKTYLIAIIVYIVLSILIAGFFIIKKIKLNTKDSKSKPTYNQHLVNLYDKLVQFEHLGAKLKNLATDLYSRYLYEVKTLKSNTMKIFIVTNIIMLICPILFYIIYKDFYYSVIVYIVMIQCQDVLIKEMIGDEYILVDYAIDFIDDIGHGYSLSKNIDSAVAYAIDLAEPLMKKHGDEIKKAIFSKETLLDYKKKSSILYLKLVASILYFAKTHGDKIYNGKSVMQSTFQCTMQSLKLTLFKFKSLSRALKGVSVMMLIPLVLPKLMQLFFSLTITEVEPVFMGSSGTLIRLGILAVSTYTYLNSKLLLSRDTTVIKAEKEITIWDRQPLAGIISSLRPKDTSATCQRLQRRLDRAGMNQSLNTLYGKRYTVALVLGIILFWVGVMYNSAIADFSVNSLYVSSGASMEFETKDGKLLTVNEIEQDYIISMLDKHNNVVQPLTTNKSKLCKEIQEKYNFEDNNASKIATDNLLELQAKLMKPKINIYCFILAMLGLFFGFMHPLRQVEKNVKMREYIIDDEVFLLTTIILVLMHHQNVSLRELFGWLTEYTVLFRHEFDEALYTLEKDRKNTLIKLRDAIYVKPIKRIIDNCMRTDKVSLEDAFTSLESEHQFRIEETKENIRQTILERSGQANKLARLSVMLSCVISIIIPLMVYSMNTLSLLDKLMNGM